MELHKCCPKIARLYEYDSVCAVIKMPMQSGISMSHMQYNNYAASFH